MKEEKDKKIIHKQPSREYVISSAPAHNSDCPDKDEQNLQAILKQLESHAAPYDDAFRTEKTQLTRLLLPVLNEAFKEHYDGTEEIKILDDRHFVGIATEREKLESDGSLSVTSHDGKVKEYLVECESSESVNDYTVAIRLFRYSQAIAIDQNAFMEENILHVKFPDAMVLYLRAGENHKDTVTFQIETPGGIISYDAPIMKLADYDVDTIFEKDLYFLIPFYILKKKGKDLDKCEKDPESLKKLLGELEEIRERLNHVLKEAGNNHKGKNLLTSYTVRVLLELMQSVTAKAAKNYPTVQMEAIKVVTRGIFITDTMREMMDAKAEGKAIGEAIGKDKNTLSLICKKLRKLQSVEMIAEALEEDVAVIQKICNKIAPLAPDYDEEKAYELLHPSDEEAISA